MTYATDSKCHNAEPGTYGHECGAPAVWIGIKGNGWQTGFCDKCKNTGAERRDILRFDPIRQAVK